MIAAAFLNWASEYLTTDMTVKMKNVKGWRVANSDPIFLFGRLAPISKNLNSSSTRISQLELLT
jgi:hypothetical protein